MFLKNIETTEIKQNPTKWGQGNNKNQCQKKIHSSVTLNYCTFIGNIMNKSWRLDKPLWNELSANQSNTEFQGSS